MSIQVECKRVVSYFSWKSANSGGDINSKPICIYNLYYLLIFVILLPIIAFMIIVIILAMQGATRKSDFGTRGSFLP